MVGGWVLDFTRFMLISTQVEVVVDVEVELGNMWLFANGRLCQGRWKNSQIHNGTLHLAHAYRG